MTLGEAIQHLKESLADPTHNWGCEECKEEHEQLLEWLEDYKRIKDEMIPAYDEQLAEAQRKVVQQMREMKQLKSDCIELDNKLRTANTEIDRLQSASSWIPCSAMLPEDDANVLAYNDGDGVLIASYDNYARAWMEALECFPLNNVTHWAPLPEAPQRKDDTHDND